MTLTPTGQAGVSMRSLRKDYGTFTALHSVDLEINSGEFVSLLGPSGCGKTTLLRCIAGLIEPSSGGIYVGGRSVAELPIHRRNFGMVFQSYALFPHMTVAQNVAFGLKMGGVSKSAAASRVAEALGMVAMDSFGGRYPHQLSGGQQQRVALARAIVTRPSILLLDEPFGALDAKLRMVLQIELRALQQKLNVTTIFVTHDQQEAMVMSDRIAVMNGGHIEQFDAPATVYNLPGTTFVADFVGQANQIAPQLAGVNRPGQVSAILRPERTRLGAAPEGALVFQGKVEQVVFSGDTILTTLATDSGPLTAAHKNTGDGVTHALGAAAQVWCLPSDIVTFDAAGKALV